MPAIHYILENPNQLRHYGTIVQDDPSLSYPLHIITEDATFAMDLKMQDTAIFSDTHTLSQRELDESSYIVVLSERECHPTSVQFRIYVRTLGEELDQICGSTVISLVISNSRIEYIVNN